MSDFDTVKQAAPLKLFAEDRLQKRGRNFICPLCGSGTHRNHTPAFSIKGERWTCFACNESGDIFDLMGAILGTDDKRAQLEAVASWANVPLQEPQLSQPHKKGGGQPSNVNYVKPKKEETPSPDYTQGRAREKAYIEQMRANLSQAEGYLASRGFTLEEAQTYGLGYDPERKRLIIPWAGSDYYHVDRDTEGRAQAKYLKPKAEAVGAQPIYNPSALEGDCFFLCEGALDALAVTVCGYQAIAAGGTGTRQITEAIGTRRYRGAVVILMDSDPEENGAGQKAAAEVAATLESMGITHTVAYLSETGAKDPAELLERDRDGLRGFLSRQHAQTLETAREKREAAYSAALASLRVVNAQDIAAELFLGQNAPDLIPTGFERLDGILDGGITKGLYFLGACPSMGKTTFLGQLADQIAERGRSVLFVSIEQSAQDLIAKSVGRGMGKRGYTVTTTDIQRPERRGQWGEEQLLALAETCGEYARDIAPRLHILEGIKQPSVRDIETIAHTIAEHDGQAPVTIIDYLQLLEPISDRDTEKRAVDRNVSALAQLANQQMRAPVIAISSLNRASYSGVITMESFKESGGIEYGGDVVLALQPKGMAGDLEGLDEKKAKTKANQLTRQHKGKLERDCELHVIKNRGGQTPEEGIPYLFKVLTSTFIEQRETYPRGQVI